GTTRGAVEGRWGPGRPLAKERVLCVVTRRAPGRPAPVLRPGAPSEVAHLHEGVPRCGRALWGEADRLVGSASRGRSSYAARACPAAQRPSQTPAPKATRRVLVTAPRGSTAGSWSRNTMRGLARRGHRYLAESSTRKS